MAKAPGTPRRLEQDVHPGTAVDQRVDIGALVGQHGHFDVLVAEHQGCHAGADGRRSGVTPPPRRALLHFDHLDETLDVAEGERPSPVAVSRIADHGGGVVVQYEAVVALPVKLTNDPRRVVVALAEEALDKRRDGTPDVAKVDISDLVAGPR